MENVMHLGVLLPHLLVPTHPRSLDGAGWMVEQAIKAAMPFIRARLGR